MSKTAAFEASAQAMANAFAQDFPDAESRTIPEGAFDFSRASLVHLDSFLLDMRERAHALGREVLHEVGLGAGAYFAEVVRRRSPVALRWVPGSVLPGGSDAYNPFLLATPKNLLLAVLGKPFKVLENGSSDSVAHFADVVQDQCSREATSVG